MAEISNTDDLCVICCYKSDLFCIGQCDHAVCFECATRMRVLCQLNECSICRTPLPLVYVVANRRSLADKSKFIKNDLTTKHGMAFENEDAVSAVIDILSHVCTICKDEPEFNTFENLSMHMRRKHELYYCDLCVENLKLFSWERKCYSRPELARHRRNGDPDDQSHKGHPLCEFCDERYLDDDFLFRHLRRDHFFCHFCDADGKNKFYPNVEKLKEHFKSDHYLCELGRCKEEHLGISFRHEIDFKAHKGTVHGKDLPKSELNKELQVNVGFNYGPNPLRRPNMSGPSRRDGPYMGGRDGSHAVGHRPMSMQNNERNFRQDRTIDSSRQPSLADSRNRSQTQPDVAAVASAAEALQLQRDAEKFKLEKEDFPSLLKNGQQKTKSKASQNVIQPMSSVVARTFNTSARRNSVGENDFPSLSEIARKEKAAKTRDDSTSPKMSKEEAQKKTFRIIDDDEEMPQASTTKETKKPTSFKDLLTSTEVGSSKKVEDDYDKWGPQKIKIAGVRNEDFPSLPAADVKKKEPRKKNTNTQSKNVWSQKAQSANVEAKKETQQTKPKEEIVKPKLNPKEFPALVSLPKTKARARLIAQNKQRPSKDDELSESLARNDENGDQRGVIIPKIASYDDVEHASYKGPPGFDTAMTVPPSDSHLTKNGPPPGFGGTQTSSAPPPGFASLTNGASASRSYEEPVSFSYSKPRDFQIRNRALFDLLSDNLRDENLKEFKSLSSAYRKGEMSADYYYECIKNLLGTKVFEKCFVELLCLLPDIEKQNELLQARVGVGGGGSSWKKNPISDIVRFCDLCKQITSVGDYREHCTTHASRKIDEDFPLLS